MLNRILILVVLVSAALAIPFIGYLTAALLEHGLNQAAWPTSAIRLDVWIATIRADNVLGVLKLYWTMAKTELPGLSYGGKLMFAVIFFLESAFIGVVIGGLARDSHRDPSGIFGNARWASRSERRKMSRGVSLGRDPETGDTIRVRIESNLVTIAPPRLGKGAGLVVPNLLAAGEATANLPVVVIDPKGEAYRAAGKRRNALGRDVCVVDPLQIVGGRDRWDPLGSVDPADVFRLRRIAQALLPSTEGENDNSEYFKNGAGALIVGALIGAKRRGKGLIAAADFIDNVDAFKQALSGATDRASRRALSILEFEPRVRDPLLSTATQAFAWLDDSRVEAVVSGSSFDLSDVARGDADLFVVIPPEDSKTLAPLMRLLLSELFVGIRRHRPPERVLIIIDEAASLGKFHEIVTASAELPGHGASLWTFWQNRAQMVETYGEQGAASLLATAEFVTISDISSVDPDELERFSRALGSFTQLVESKSEGSSGGEKPSRQSSSSRSPQPVRLMTPEALKTMPSDQLILLPNSKLYAKHPVILTKLRSYADPEFAPFIEDTNPVRDAG